MSARVEPWMIYAGLGVLAYFLIKKAKDNLSLGGGLVGSVGDVLVGAPQETKSTPATPVPTVQKYRGLFARWISPALEGKADRALFRRDYDVVFEVENATGSMITGLLEVEVEEHGLVGSPTRVTTTAGPYSLADGEVRQFRMALRTDTLIASTAFPYVRLAGRLAVSSPTHSYEIR